MLQTISKIMLMEKAKTEEDFLKTWKEIEQKVEKNHNYTEDQKEFIGRAVIALLPSIYKGQELEKVLEECKGKGGKINMFAVTERLEKEYIRKLKNAREEGREEGIKETNLQNAKKMLELGIPISDISAITGLSKEQIMDL